LSLCEYLNYFVFNWIILFSDKKFAPVMYSFLAYFYDFARYFYSVILWMKYRFLLIIVTIIKFFLSAIFTTREGGLLLLN